MDKLLYQLANRLEAVKDPSMIDPVEFGELKGAVSALQIQVTDFKSRQAVMDQKLDLVLSRMAEAKGGWRTLMLLGGAASSAGAGLTWLVQHWPRG